MTNSTSTNDRITVALAAIECKADATLKRAQQLQGYFDNRRSSSGFLAAIETVRSSMLVELAEHDIYVELTSSISTATQLDDSKPLTPEQTFALVERFSKRLASAARRSIEADSSGFMSNAMAVARHNAMLRVLEVLEECVEHTRRTDC